VYKRGICQPVFLNGNLSDASLKSICYTGIQIITEKYIEKNNKQEL